MRRAPLFGLIVFMVAGCSQSNKRVALSPELDPFPRNLRYTHDYKLFQTTNGLTFALVPEDRTNLVSVDVRYKVGAAEDPVGKEGLAHFVEHLMFQINSKDSTGTLNDRLNAKSLFFNAYTNFDETHYTSTALREFLAPLLKIEAERMGATCDSIDDERVERERQIVKAELTERSGVGSELVALLSAAVFPAQHPYGRRSSGTTATIDAITREDICRFMDEHYGPNRAILVVSGKFDANAVNVFVTHNFGPITSRATGKRAPLTPLSLSGSRSEHTAPIEKPAMVMAFPSPPWGTAPEKDQGLFLSLLENRLEGLVGTKIGITSVGGTRLGGFRGGARILVFDLTEKADTREIEKAVFKKASELARDITKKEVNRFKGRYRTSIIARHEPYAGRALNVADYLQYTTHNRFLLRDLERIDQMTVERLQLESESINSARTHVAVIKPTGKDAKQSSVELTDAGKEFDLETWRVAVDSSLGDRPIEAKVARPERELLDFKLANGLRVILAPDFSYPTIDIRLLFPAGSANDPKEKPGTALLAGFLLTDDADGFASLYDVLVYRDLDLIGAQVSPDVHEDYTSFSIRGMSLYADALLWQLYFRVQSGSYSEKQFDAIRDAAKESDAELDADKSLEVRTALFGPNHPYAKSLTARTILKLSKDEIDRFRDRYYRAQGSTIIVTGQFDVEVMRKRIERLWGPWGAEPSERLRVVPPAASPAKGPTAFFVEDKKRLQPRIVIFFALDPSKSGPAHRLVLRELLAQRLAAIRERLGASYGMKVRLDQARGPWVLTITGNVEPARAAEALVEVRAAIASVREGGVTVAADFVRARRRVLERLLADSASATSTADELEYIAANEVGIEYFTELARQVAALTSSELSTIASPQLAERREVLLLNGSKSITKKMLNAAGIRKSKEIR